ncbi:hypothetical protein [Mesorhizobium sp. IMUNJ 23232]|uniref:hypothetical protein n=1 Tax=Mesorhizobium sp. IMUNJ 23232 TaxID=3376064 RepID=UPI003794E9F0
MPFQLRSLRFVPGGNELIQFEDDILCSLVGLSAFSLSYGSGVDHHVETMSVSIKVTPMGTRALFVEAMPILFDDSGNRQGDGSYVCVSVLAWVGEAPSVGSVSMPPPITLNNGESADLDDYPQIAALSGFDLSYGDSDHHLLGAEASVLPSWSTISAMAGMADGDGNFASTAEIAAVVMEFIGSFDLIVIKSVSLDDEGPQTIDMGVPLAQVGIFMSSFRATYSGTNHAVQTFGAGPNIFAIDRDDRTKVNTSGIWSFVWDDSGNKGSGPCDLLIVGIPAAD